MMQPGQAVDGPDVDTAAAQVDGQGEAGRSGADDQHIGHRGHGAERGPGPPLGAPVE
jgi:hypothetical protein